MRTKSEVTFLNNLKNKSLTKNEDFTNYKGERFVYEHGQLTAYTDTRVIDHDTDRLVNLAEEPYED